MPSNLALARVGARIWIARIAIVWGLVSMAMMFAVGPRSFNALRFLLGAAEAGFFPGHRAVFHLLVPGARARPRRRAVHRWRSMAAGIVGAPLSGALLSLRGVGGLDGWQWLFLVEGVPAVVLGIVAFIYLDDGPDGRAWLPDDEKAWLVDALRREREEHRKRISATVRAGLLEPGGAGGSRSSCS